MTLITENHFGANIVLTNDSAKEGSPFVRMLEDLNFTEFRYPGGSVTENATWANGGMERIFGEPMAADDPNYVMTMREALALCEEKDVSMLVVVPTKQFLNYETNAFDSVGFDKYLGELETTLREFPDVKISGFEIGNEFWGHDESDAGFERVTPTQYGIIADNQIGKLAAMNDRLAEDLDSWEKAGIGVQAGAQWRQTHKEESQEIIAEISMENRALVDTVFQHVYPNVGATGPRQVKWATDAMNEFDKASGFPADLHKTISEFNIHGGGQGENGANLLGNRLAGGWIEEMSRVVDSGVDSINHWGIQYKWLAHKMYDKEPNPAPGTAPDDVKIGVTPVGMVYDLAQQHLIGKETMTDADAMAGITAPEGLGITGFESENQRVVFLHNASKDAKALDFSKLDPNAHVTAYLLTPADNPATGANEALTISTGNANANTRSDMSVISGKDVRDFDIPAEGILVVTITAPGIGVNIFGSDQKTDTRTDEGQDLIVGGSGKDILHGGAGDDLIIGGEDGETGRDVLSGGKGNDTLQGGTSGDVLISDDGQDDLYTEGGKNLVLVGGDEGTANVSLNGGQNVVLNSGQRNMVVEGFSKTDDLGLNGAFKNKDAFAAATSISGQDVLITLPDGKVITLTGYAAQRETLQNQIFDFYALADADALIGDALTGLRTEQAEFATGTGKELAHLADGTNAWPDLDTLPLFETDLDGNETLINGPLPEPEIPEVPETPGTPIDPDPVDPTDPSEPGPTEPETPVNPNPGNSGGDDEDEDDGDEETPQNSGSGGGGPCFVATAAYGDRMNPEVVALRRFRDEHLIRYRAGRAFVRFYWIVGPMMAAKVSPESLLGKGVRAVLGAFVAKLRAANLTSGR